MNVTKKRGAAIALSNGDDLFTMNIYGTDASNVSTLYATDIIDATTTTTNSLETSRIFSLALGSALVEVLRLNSIITAKKPVVISNTGFQQASREITLNANASYASTWREYVGSHILVAQNTQGWSMAIGNGVDYQGAICNIENISLYALTITITAGTFYGPSGSATTSYTIYPFQTVELVATSTGYRVVGIRNLPSTYRMRNSVSQSLATTSTPLVYNTEETTGIEGSTGIRSWSGVTLSYSAGTFTSQYAYPMTLLVQATCVVANANLVRAIGIEMMSATRNPVPTINWVMVPANTSSAGTMTCCQQVTLGSGEAFRVVAQALGSATTINAGSKVIITRMGQ
jgi:hypothetical protein